MRVGTVGALCLALAATGLMGAAAQGQSTSVTVVTGASPDTTSTVTSTPTGAAATQAQVTANTGAFSGSGQNGGLTLGTGTGTLEGSLLAAISLKQAARQILSEQTAGSAAAWASNPGSTPSGANPPVSGPLIVPGETMPDFSAHELYSARVALLDKQLVADLAMLKTRVDESTTPPPPPPQHGGAKVGALPAVVAAGLAFTDLGKVLSYGATTNQTLGGAVNGFDDTILAVALAGEARNHNQVWPISTQIDGTPLIPRLQGEMDQLNAHVAAANTELILAATTSASLNLASNPPQAVKAKITDIQAASAAVTADLAAYNTYATGLATPGVTSLLSIAQAAEQEWIAHHHGVILVHMVSGNGGVFATQTLGGVFGTPIKAAGGVVVFYAYQPPTTGEDAPTYASADVVASVTPYHTFSKVDRLVVFDRYRMCAEGYGQTESSRKYCPMADSPAQEPPDPRDPKSH